MLEFNELETAIVALLAVLLDCGGTKQVSQSDLIRGALLYRGVPLGVMVEKFNNDTVIIRLNQAENLSSSSLSLKCEKDITDESWIVSLDHEKNS